MNELEWVKGKPKKPGWYWVCEDGFLHYPNLYEMIYLFSFSSNGNIELCCTRDVWYYDKNWYNNFWFAGPIPIPVNKSDIEPEQNINHNSILPSPSFAQKYLEINTAVAKAIGVRADLSFTIGQLEKKKRKSKWLIEMLRRIELRMPQVIINLREYRALFEEDKQEIVKEIEFKKRQKKD